MKKAHILCYIVAFVGLTIMLLVVCYSNLIADIAYADTIMWGSSVVILISLILLSHMQKRKNIWVFYCVCLLCILNFTLSLFL